MSAGTSSGGQMDTGKKSTGKMSTGRKIALVALLPLMLAGWTLIHRSVVLVHVDTEGAPHLVVPMPLILAEGAVHFLPAEAKFAPAPEVAEYLPHIERALEALREGGDGVYVEVTDDDEHVRIAKEADVLRVHVRDGADTEVDVQASFSTALAALRAYDTERGGFHTSGLVGALRSMPRGQVVHVLDGTDEVSIRMW